MHIYIYIIKRQTPVSLFWGSCTTLVFLLPTVPRLISLITVLPESNITQLMTINSLIKFGILLLFNVLNELIN